MKYPTLLEVERASHEQLAHWSRFLPSPGENYIGADDAVMFKNKLEEEVLIMKRIWEKFQELGGWNPILSKQVGWGK